MRSWISKKNESVLQSWCFIIPLCPSVYDLKTCTCQLKEMPMRCEHRSRSSPLVIVADSLFTKWIIHFVCLFFTCFCKCKAGWSVLDDFSSKCVWIQMQLWYNWFHVTVDRFSDTTSAHNIHLFVFPTPTLINQTNSHLRMTPTHSLLTTYINFHHISHLCFHTCRRHQATRFLSRFSMLGHVSHAALLHVVI